MDKLVKGTIIAIATITLLATTALAAALPITDTFEKAGYSITWNEQTKTVTIEKPVTMPQTASKASHYTKACVTKAGDGYIIADTLLGTVCIMVDKSMLCIGGTLSDIKKQSELEVHFSNVTAGSDIPCVYADKIIIN